MNFSAASTGWLVVATLALLLPGAVVLAAAGWGARRRVLAGLAAAPLVTVGVCYATSLVTGTLGVRYGPVAVGLGTLVLAAAVVLLRGVRDPRALLPARRAARRWRPEVLLGVGLAVVAAVISVRTWAYGLVGTLSTVPQEHDMVTHTLLTAHVARTGRAAPWEAWTYDVLSGSPSGFYPSGFHVVAALTADLGADPVTALNATVLAVLSVFLPLGLLALARQVAFLRLPTVVGGVAALAAVMAYRPTYAILHDGGILANHMAIVLAPGALATLLLLRDRTPVPVRAGPRRELGLDVAVVALTTLGAFAVHPTSALILGLTGVAWTVGELVHRSARRRLLPRVARLVPGLLVAGVLALPTVAGGGSSVGAVTEWPRDLPVQGPALALRTAVGMPYLGFLDAPGNHFQLLLAVLALGGVVVLAVTRRGLGLLAAWVLWTAVLLVFLLGAQVPLLSSVVDIFYSSYVRLSGVLGPFQWLAVGVLLSKGGSAVAALLARALRRRRPARRAGLPRWAPVAAAGVLAVLLLGLTTGYRYTNGVSLAQRYGDPQFSRFDGGDRLALDYLAERVGPGERVMNNANDGSSYLYVLAGIPVVNVSPLGNAGAPYSIDLLAGFNQLDTDPRIRELVRELDIRWVYFDKNSPPIWAPSAQYPWLPGAPGRYSIAPGMTDLDRVRDLAPRFSAGSVVVYEVAQSVFDEPAAGTAP